ncbi:LysR family transcriptional regulator [Pseudomonas sp. LRF_L74]|uniref:LysR family transcriptional regulator n=1 Tax=Pseudomonas sp. LRF_L74 TaxID=3369422 RepID=UPI003F635D75
MRFTFKQLEYFRATAETGSFSAAASELHVSSTAVAAAVSDLEQALETQLCLRRKSHGVVLTPAGQHVLQMARNLLISAEELDRSTRSRDGTLRGPVTIGCYSTLAATVIPALTKEFEARYPEVILSYHDGDNDELLPLMEAGQLDLLITYRINLPAGLEETALFDTAVHALLPADHALASRETLSFEDLRDEPLIMLDLPPSGRHALDMLHGAGVRPKVRHRTRNFELVRSMVARGLGYSLLIQKPRIDHSYEGLPLVVKRIEPNEFKETVVMVWPDHIQLNARVQALIEFAHATIRMNQFSLA